MSDIVERLRGTTRAMAFLCSVDMALWNDHSNACLEAAAEIERLRNAIKRQAGAALALQAHTMQTVAHLKQKDRSEYRAAATLDSEREANARLTEEVERLRTLNADLVWALLEARTDLMIAANNADDAAKTDPRWEGVSSRLRERNHQIDAVLTKTEGGNDG